MSFKDRLKKARKALHKNVVLPAMIGAASLSNVNDAQASQTTTNDGSDIKNKTTQTYKQETTSINLSDKYNEYSEYNSEVKKQWQDGKLQEARFDAHQSAYDIGNSTTLKVVNTRAMVNGEFTSHNQNAYVIENGKEIDISKEFSELKGMHIQEVSDGKYLQADKEEIQDNENALKGFSKKISKNDELSPETIESLKNFAADFTKLHDAGKQTPVQDFYVTQHSKLNTNSR